MSCCLKIPRPRQGTGTQARLAVPLPQRGQGASRRPGSAAELGDGTARWSLAGREPGAVPGRRGLGGRAPGRLRQLRSGFAAVRWGWPRSSGRPPESQRTPHVSSPRSPRPRSSPLLRAAATPPAPRHACAIVSWPWARWEPPYPRSAALRLAAFRPGAPLFPHAGGSPHPASDGHLFTQFCVYFTADAWPPPVRTRSLPFRPVNGPPHPLRVPGQPRGTSQPLC
ncbi:hypothetical protein J1605_021998 [Eschrichtius robustus]|uniref:Uncharacterized protein n=1 Tax=Eschrichtius robustus TaxID=9764 RepID=A0AB34HEM6_ESCRO|nr:hypothetical protein J1605_021998 [Eschrichtius robustus]